MNSRQLCWILSNDQITSRNFKGIYALDEIEHIKQISFPSAYVFNLDPSYKPGVHWVAVYIDRKRLHEYLDVFPQEKQRLFVHLCKKLELQSCTCSRICGQFVAFYVYQRCSGLTLESII